MNYILIATHSELAEGMYKAIKYFNSENQTVDFLNCYINSNNVKEELEEKIKNNLNKNIVICTDIAYGSVNQIAHERQNTYEFHLSSGINWAGMLDLAFSTEDLTNERITDIVTTGKDQLVYLNKLNANKKSEEVEQQDDDEL